MQKTTYTHVMKNTVNIGSRKVKSIARFSFFWDVDDLVSRISKDIIKWSALTGRGGWDWTTGGEISSVNQEYYHENVWTVRKI